MPSPQKQTCLSLNCPEHTGGECNAGQKEGWELVDYSEEYESLAHALQEHAQPPNTPEWGNGYWAGIEFAVSFFAGMIDKFSIQMKEERRKVAEEMLEVMPTVKMNKDFIADTDETNFINGYASAISEIRRKGKEFIEKL